MTPFEAQALRLKMQLGVTLDAEVAKHLGLASTAYTRRKKRGSFPEKDLYALAGRRPDLGLNVDYILHGNTEPALPENLTADETAFLTAFRSCNPAGKREILRMVNLFIKPTPDHVSIWSATHD